MPGQGSGFLVPSDDSSVVRIAASAVRVSKSHTAVIAVCVTWGGESFGEFSDREQPLRTRMTTVSMCTLISLSPRCHSRRQRELLCRQFSNFLLKTNFLEKGKVFKAKVTS